MTVAHALTRGTNVIQFLSAGIHWNDALILKRYTDETRRIHPFSLSPESWRYVREMPWGEIGPYEEAFAREGERIAAVSVACSYGEGERGRTFYPALRELTRRHGALLIFDEIVMGFRLARAGAQEFFGVTPDLTLAHADAGIDGSMSTRPLCRSPD